MCLQCLHFCGRLMNLLPASEVECNSNQSVNPSFCWGTSKCAVNIRSVKYIMSKRVNTDNVYSDCTSICDYFAFIAVQAMKVLPSDLQI